MELRNYAIFLGIIGILLSFVILPSFIKSQKLEVCKDCNLVFIDTFCLRAQDMSVYGFAYNTTPFLSRLSKSSIVFDNAFSQSTNTFPSHMSVITSLYPSCSGVSVPERDDLSLDVETLPQILHDNGYLTLWGGELYNAGLNEGHGFGRGIDYVLSKDWDVVIRDIPQLHDKKFALFLHTPKLHDPYTPSKRALEQVFGEGFDHPMRNFDQDKQTNLEARSLFLNQSFIKGLLTQQAFINYSQYNWSSMSNKEFNATVSKFISTWVPDPDKFKYVLYRSGYRVMRSKYYLAFNLKNKSNAEVMHKLYCGEIAEVDEMIKRVIDALNDTGLLNKTIVVVSSDHGTEFLEHGFVFQLYLSDETTHVPLIIRFPSRTHRRVQSIVENIDIMPTLLGSLGISIPKKVQGLNLFTYLAKDKPFPHKLAFSEFIGMKSVRTELFRFIDNGNNTQRYNGWVKRYELRNVINGNDAPENVIMKSLNEASRLNQVLASWSNKNQACPYTPISKWPNYVSPETKKRILNTGYW